MAIGWRNLKEVEENLLYFHFVHHKLTKITLGLHSDLCNEKIQCLKYGRGAFALLLNIQTSSDDHLASYSVVTGVLSWGK